MQPDWNSKRKKTLIEKVFVLLSAHKNIERKKYNSKKYVPFTSKYWIGAFHNTVIFNLIENFSLRNVEILAAVARLVTEKISLKYPTAAAIAGRNWSASFEYVLNISTKLNSPWKGVEKTNLKKNTIKTAQTENTIFYQYRHIDDTWVHTAETFIYWKVAEKKIKPNIWHTVIWTLSELFRVNIYSVCVHLQSKEFLTTT